MSLLKVIIAVLAVGVFLYWKNITPIDLPIVETPTPLSQMKNINVIRVVDGDTIICDINNNNRERIRFIGIDTPEIGHRNQKEREFANKAKDFVERHLSNNLITLEFEKQLRDRYGRLLAHVWLGRVNFQSLLLENGLARAMTVSPNTKYQALYQEKEGEARENMVGLWEDH
ncbi:hypothetical protein ABK040_013621 [Willaertia magna]